MATVPNQNSPLCARSCLTREGGKVADEIDKAEDQIGISAASPAETRTPFDLDKANPTPHTRELPAHWTIIRPGSHRRVHG
ncbi:hypothetical protein WI560_12240 [Bradyrhizobium sp. A11]|uniref:hypothetical protein n=1 Tax=Bradyrhizobium sp. A11 TaxID=3133974 RepID=UPI00324D60B3